MFGYIRPAARDASGTEQERFRTVYCGLCHALRERYGFAAQFVLNFDFTFLAILLSLGTPSGAGCRRCALHPLRGCRAAEPSAALDTAAACSVVLSWWQLQDHVADHGFFAALPYRAAALLLRGAYRRARADAADFDAAAQRLLRELSEREVACCASLDAAAEPFAALLALLAEAEPDTARRRIFAHIFYHLGRWIYLVDAADDFAADAKRGNYNPLRYRFSIEGSTLTEEARRALGETLDDSIRQMAGAYALLDACEWAGLLDGIFYDSLYAVGSAVLRSVDRRPPRFRRKRSKEGGTI